MSDQSRISAMISAVTKERLDRFTESPGLKKSFVVEQALLYFMEARRKLPGEALREQTPEARMTRIRGVLDSVTVSTQSFTLQLEGKVTLLGLMTSLAPEQLAAHLGCSVVVEGCLYFKPSGQPWRIEADYIAAAQPGDELWARVPRAEAMHRQSVLPTADIGVAFGQWPGDETDEELFAALEQLS